MHLTEDKLRIFGLTDAEAKVLLALIERGPMRVSKLGRVANVPRTTAYSALVRLKDRGFVKHIYKGQFARRWRVSQLLRLKKLVQEALETFEPGPSREAIAGEAIIGAVDSAEIGIQVFRGKHEILRAYEEMFKLSKAERVIAIQGNKSADEALKALDLLYLFSFHEKLKKSGVIIEGLNGEHVLEIFNNLNEQQLKSHFGRAFISCLVPDQYMDFQLDVLVMRESVLFIDVKAELVTVVHYKAIVALFNGFVGFIQEHGKRTDINAYIAKLIEEKKRNVV